MFWAHHLLQSHRLLALKQKKKNKKNKKKNKKKEDGKEEDTADHGCGEGRWVWIPAEDGFRQGSPLSCMLAALACVKCVTAAQKAMDDYYGLRRAGEAGGGVAGGGGE